MVKPILLFWTGGWDSTFRLLQLVLIEKRPVQPFYLVNYRRQSLDREWKTMNLVRKMVFHKMPEAKQLLLPTIYFHKFFLKHNKEIDRQFKNLESTMDIGLQYKWFAQLAEQFHLEAFEIGFVTIQDHVPSTINLKLRELGTGEGENRRLDPSKELGDMALFKSFRLPIFHLSKTDMAHIAGDHGFYDILSHTWFCLRPLPTGLPCRSCRPCILAEKNRMNNWSDHAEAPFQRKINKLMLVFYLAMIHLTSHPGSRLRMIS